ncbi:unnamed protein product [Clonostachys solani]|uniref:WW domain-containing protein n=1 Tax=Clonostachys solani TaxID=160281 RepID=A0A9P0ES63_9HYPO|nr:unnamed protein product [Clonostachys solani]
MSTPQLSSPTATAGAPGPLLPPGWEANWSPEHNTWYYIFTATGLTQWEFPAFQPPQPPFTPISPALEKQAPAPDQQNIVPDQQGAIADQQSPDANQTRAFPFPDQQLPPPDQYQSDTLQGAGPPPQDGDRGLGTTALALGGGFLAGNAFGNHHHGGSGAGFGKMAASFAAGAIGTKVFGFLKNKPQKQPTYTPQPQPQPQVQTQVHYYPAYMPSPQGPPPQGMMTPPGPMTPPHAPPPSYHGYGQSPPVTQNLGHNSSPAPSGPPPGFQSPAAPTMGNFAPPSGPQLHIHAAAFADKNVTDLVRRLVTPQQELLLKGENLVEKLGDPWPEVERKMFSVLYSYGERPMELLAVCSNKGNIEIKNEAISKTRMDFCHAPPSRIVACVWGTENALTTQRLEKLEQEGEMEGSAGILGNGGFWAWELKALICYYRTETGSVDIKFCRDGGTIRLPWNPLAKWS